MLSEQDNRKEYIALLEAIYTNAVSIEKIAALILGESLKGKNAEERLTLVSFSENFLFASIDEIGKFYLIKGQYPKRLNIIDLHLIGFRDHDKKLKALIEVVKQRQQTHGAGSRFTVEQTISMLRHFKDTTLHIDYKDGKIIKPSDSQALRADAFNSYIVLINLFVEMARADLNIFKMSK